MVRRCCLLLVFVVAWGGEAQPDTDCPDPLNFGDSIRFQSPLFVGTVRDWDGTQAEVDVEEVWRGPDLDREVVVVPEPGRRYAKGGRYLFFPDNSRSPFTDPACSATTQLTDSVAELRPDSARLITAMPGGPPWRWILSIAGGAVLFVIGWNITKRARRGPPPEWDPDHRLADEQ